MPPYVTLPRASWCLALLATPWLGWPAVGALAISGALLAFDVWRSSRVSEVAGLEERLTSLRNEHVKLANSLGIKVRG